MILTAATCVRAQQTWRSRLYPADWTPAFTAPGGLFLHDFSYAGYRYGEVSLPVLEQTDALNVVGDFGADASGKADATSAIQRAIDAAQSRGGGVVYLPAGSYRCDGTLSVTHSGVVLRGAGPEATRVFFTGFEGLRHRSHVVFRGAVKQGEDIPLAADAPNRARVVTVSDAGDLAVGDDVSLGWVITDAFVSEHGMTGTWRVFNGKWRPFFRRTVRAVDRNVTPHRITLDVPVRYRCKVRDKASLRRETGYLRECGLEQLALANAVAWKNAWSKDGVRVVAFQGAADCWVRQVASFRSPLPEAKGYHLQNGGIKVLDSKRVTVADCRMEFPQNRGGGGCGYLFEVSRSNGVLTRDCVARDGRHNFIQNWDFGTAGCVWLRCRSEGSRAYAAAVDPIGWPAYCEYHHSLAMACLVDSCTLADGWYGGNRHDWSSGAGTTVTQSVFWNTCGKGVVGSWQFGNGYVIGTRDVTVKTDLAGRWSRGSEPTDTVEGRGRGATLAPQSLYDDQLARRTGQ